MSRKKNAVKNQQKFYSFADFLRHFFRCFYKMYGK
nr:MAG TPA: General transcription and DNA repair, DNA repair, helicase, multiprotein.7A [Caudoviricetes sp.]